MTDPPPLSPRRLRSRRQLLATIRESGGVSRAELRGLTGLSRSAVADGVQALLADGLVVEHPAAAGGARGRPAALLHPSGPDGMVAGIDIGHAHVSAALARTTGGIVAERRAQVDVDAHASAALDTAAGLVERLLDEAEAATADLLAVAAGIPGPLDLHSNRVRSPTILSSWVDLLPDAELARRIGRPVQVCNDADMGARGELRFGAARGCRDFMYVKASHGIGAGLVLGGETYRGAVGVAGEIGHTQVDGAGNLCRCGNRGCLETVVSITEVLRQLGEARVEAAVDDELSLAAISGDPVVARLLAEAGRTLGSVLAGLCNLLNPAVIVLGGELGAVGGPFARGVRESIDRRAQPAVAEAVDIRTAELGHRSELLGAVATATQGARDRS
jgi:predicted NBD/HSP70 family sugar kinase/biotin operon repressor